MEHSWGQGRCTLSCGGRADDFDDHFDDYDDNFHDDNDDNFYDNNDDDGHDDYDDDHEYDSDDDYDVAELGQAPCTEFQTIKYSSFRQYLKKKDFFNYKALEV